MNSFSSSKTNFCLTISLTLKLRMDTAKMFIGTVQRYFRSLVFSSIEPTCATDHRVSKILKLFYISLEYNYPASQSPQVYIYNTTASQTPRRVYYSGESVSRFADFCNLLTLLGHLYPGENWLAAGYKTPHRLIRQVPSQIKNSPETGRRVRFSYLKVE